MSIPNHLATTEVVLLEVEILSPLLLSGLGRVLLATLSGVISKKVMIIPIMGIMHCLTQLWFPVLPVFFAQRRGDD